VASIVVWVVGTLAGWAVAFLPSLLAAAVAYVVAGLLDRRAAVSGPR
jgi:TctA family transporter